MRELIRRAMAEAVIRKTLLSESAEIDRQLGIDASSEREPGLEETQQEHLPLLNDLIREHRAMLEERRLQQRAHDASFRMTMYQWGRRALGHTHEGKL
jgi:hypothetical protein